MSTTVELRTADGYTYGDKLVVPVCPLCGRVHVHTNNGYREGDRTSRVPHCFKGDVVWIHVRGEMEQRKIPWLMRKWRYGIANRVRRKVVESVELSRVGRG